jgi:hypothetical protein
MKTKRFFILSFKFLAFVLATVEMYNIVKGKLILKKNLVKNRLDISSLDNDVYLLRINVFEENLIKSNYS